MAPISNDLLLAAALSGAVPAALAQTPTPPVDGSRQRSGVVTTVRSDARGASSSTMYIDNATEQRLTTDANTRMHVLFSDQSAITLAPDSELVIAKYQFDPKAKEGQLLINMTKGLLRVVGGLISKKTETVVRTSTATIGIRGGITMIETADMKTTGVFLFGDSMRASDNNGNTQTVTRAGFGTTFSDVGMSNPQRVPSSNLNDMRNRLESRLGTSNDRLNAGDSAPPGQLLSTGDRPGAADSPDKTLASDRLKNVVDTNAGHRPSQTLRDILGTGQIQNQS